MAFYFELKANQEFEILNQVNDEEPVRVIREGNTIEVPKCDIVVGDIVMIGTGDDIPADAELLESVQLTVDESTLTGEPLCAKTLFVRKQRSKQSSTTKPLSPPTTSCVVRKSWQVTAFAAFWPWAMPPKVERCLRLHRSTTV